MTTQPSSRLITLPAAIVIALALLWNLTFSLSAAFPMSLIGVLGRLAIWPAALVLLIVCAFVFLAYQPRRAFVLPAALLVTLPLQWFFGATLALQTRLQFIRPQLMAEVQRIHAAAAAGQPQQHGEVRAEYSASPTNPPVAFIDGGLADNWCGYVYDPTGTLDNIVHLRPVPAPASDWFGGRMTSVRRLGGGWFYCSFT
jgi:hypothetical protein